MTFKAVILLRRRDDMTPEQFRTWWLDEHAPLAAQLPGALRVVFNLCEPGGEVDGVSELWFDDEAAFTAAYAGELGQRVAADSIAHVAGRTRLFVTEHAVVGELPPLS